MPDAVDLPGVAQRVLDLGAGHWLTLVGGTAETVGEALKAAQGRRGALLLPAGAGRGTEAVLEHWLDDLADLALACWPRWRGGDDAGPDAATPWLRAAGARAAAGRRPRLPRAARATEFKNLMGTVEPADPVLVADVDPGDPGRARPVIQVLEWCAARGASVVATLPTRPAAVAPYDRILYNALDIAPTVAPVRTRFIAPSGRAHPGSAIERQVEAALHRDPELGPLFSFNETVAIHGYGAPPRVDLLWRDGRVVVELDGPEHQADPKFASDRHRDYELLVAGYLVLRITNDQVATDLQSAIEKIRAVVRFRAASANRGTPP
jgi:very-short-patch-repair endonuclease